MDTESWFLGSCILAPLFDFFLYIENFFLVDDHLVGVLFTFAIFRCRIYLVGEGDDIADTASWLEGKLVGCCHHRTSTLFALHALLQYKKKQGPGHIDQS